MRTDKYGLNEVLNGPILVPYADEDEKILIRTNARLFAKRRNIKVECEVTVWGAKSGLLRIERVK